MHQQISIISIHIYCTQAWVGLSSKHKNSTTTTHLANGLGISQLNLSAFISMTREFLKNPCIYSSSWLAKIFSLIFLAGIRSQGSQRHFHRSEKFPARPMPKLYIDFYLWLDFWPMKTYIVLLQKKILFMPFHVYDILQFWKYCRISKKIVLSLQNFWSLQLYETIKKVQSSLFCY